MRCVNLDGVGGDRGAVLLRRVLAGSGYPAPAGGDLGDAGPRSPLIVGAEGPLRHAVRMPPRSARYVPWPEWVPPPVRQALAARGVAELWSHQAEAAELAHAGTDVVVATGTASGKSLAYQLPVLAGFAADRRCTALYLSPTKALAADQLRSLEALGLPDVRPAALDGDTPLEARDWARRHGRWLFSNPDMLHRVGAAPARPMGCVPAQAALRGRRRVPHLPRGLRLARGPAAAPAAADLRALRSAADDRAGLGDGGRPGRVRLPADRPRRLPR